MIEVANWSMNLIEYIAQKLRLNHYGGCDR
jgi:hypothetical protein